MKKTISCCLLALLVFLQAFAQSSIEVYPTHWWTGMKWNKVQLMIHEKNQEFIVAVDKLIVRSSSPDLQIIKINKVENRRYLFIDVAIAPNARPQTVTISLGGAMPKDFGKVTFELRPRRGGNGTAFAQGVTSKDLVYLLMPDRFSNGDPSNDRVAGLRDQSLNRDSIYDRHGGDFQGVINHLDYLNDLGVTTVWMTPVIENDMPNRTEHGYAFTNHYRIEPRFGGPAMYQKLSDELHKRGMKLIQDAVYNHVGSYHFTVLDPPMKDWLNQWPAFTQTSYKDQVLFDPYAAPDDKKKMSDGWFVRQMPDMNQHNPYVANYLIQHAIWSVEEFGVDGWRIDTYAYNDLVFMNRCNQALMDEYPRITMFGETWVHGVPNQSYFCQNNYAIPFKSNLQATTDFQTLFYGIQPAVNEAFGWTEGVNKLYTTAAQDFVYKNPMRQVIFLDNHDLPRFYSVAGEDTAKYKMAMGWLLTFRGIPQLYYGDEIIMAGFTNPDGNVRLDFKGGWPEDKDNKFTAAGRTEKEQGIFEFIRVLARFRKTSSAITSGKMMQYIPYDGVYVYFRYDDKQTIMVIMNTGAEAKQVNMSRFEERTKGFTTARNINDGAIMDLAGSKPMPGKTIRVFELR
jgi:neopullulanase